MSGTSSRAPRREAVDSASLQRMTDGAERATHPPVRVGLCERCRHVHVVENRRGSRFYRCTLADTDPRFPKYPRLPVLRCDGFAPGSQG